MIDFLKIIRENTPVELRNEAYVRLLEILSEPLFFNRNYFENWKLDRLFELNLTPSVINLEFYLNNKYDPELKRIKIYEDISLTDFDFDSSENQAFVFDFSLAENQIFEYIFYRVEATENTLDTDFIIKLPTEILESFGNQIYAKVIRVVSPTITFAVN